MANCSDPGYAACRKVAGMTMNNHSHMTEIMTMLHEVRTRISEFIKLQCISPLIIVNHKNMIILRSEFIS